MNYSIICSVYKNIKLKDLKESFQSLHNQSIKSKDLIIVIDGYCDDKIIQFISTFLKRILKINTKFYSITKIEEFHTHITGQFHKQNIIM